MPDGQRPGQGFHQRLLGEIVADIAEAMGAVEAALGVVADDAAGLLPTMLKRVQPERHKVRRLGDADHTEDAAFLMQAIIVERMREKWLHGAARLTCGAAP